MPAIQESLFMTRHPFGAQDQAAMAAMRAIVEPNKGMLRGTAARGTFDAIMERVAAPEGVAYEADMVGGVPGSARSSESRLYSLVRTSAL